MMQPFIESKREEIAALCRMHHVRSLSIFGSAVRDDFDPERSDVDVRVLFDDHAFSDYARNLHSFHDCLAELLGRSVDLLSAERIPNRFFYEEITSTQVLLYAA